MEEIEITGEYIQLNQLLKTLNWVENGGEANDVIDQGLVKVNGETELRKRNKIYNDFVIEFNGQKAKVIIR